MLVPRFLRLAVAIAMIVALVFVLGFMLKLAFLAVGLGLAAFAVLFVYNLVREVADRRGVPRISRPAG